MTLRAVILLFGSFSWQVKIRKHPTLLLRYAYSMMGGCCVGLVVLLEEGGGGFYIRVMATLVRLETS
jgi:hypothetical protein